MWFLILLAALAVLLIIGNAIAVCFIFLRSTPRQMERSFRKWDRLSVNYRDQIDEGKRFLAEQPHEEVGIASYDGLRLCARYYPCGDSKRTILLFHGYRSSGEHDFASAVVPLHRWGFNLLVVDQRAHGKSEGHLITFGVKERRDALDWASYVSERFGREYDLFLEGLSMGASTVLMAADLPLPENVRGIIADCGFTSPGDIIRKVARQQYHLRGNLIIPVMDFISRTFFDFGLDEVSTTQTLKKCTVPLLLVHGKQDGFVPFEMSERGYEAAASEKRIVLVDGADHGMSYLIDPDTVTGALKQFLGVSE